jgi:patatin-like phospholipase/acyl hydrolase
LCDYFDYIGGTSTGAIIAAGLARGKSVAELIEFYRDAESTQAEFHSMPWSGSTILHASAERRPNNK